MGLAHPTWAMLPCDKSWILHFDAKMYFCQIFWKTPMQLKHFWSGGGGGECTRRLRPTDDHDLKSPWLESTVTLKCQWLFGSRSASYRPLLQLSEMKNLENFVDVTLSRDHDEIFPRCTIVHGKFFWLRSSKVCKNMVNMCLSFRMMDEELLSGRTFDLQKWKYGSKNLSEPIQSFLPNWSLRIQ